MTEIISKFLSLRAKRANLKFITPHHEIAAVTLVSRKDGVFGEIAVIARPNKVKSALWVSKAWQS